jgi:hypothetical protein
MAKNNSVHIFNFNNLITNDIVLLIPILNKKKIISKKKGTT